MCSARSTQAVAAAGQFALSRAVSVSETGGGAAGGGTAGRGTVPGRALFVVTAGDIAAGVVTRRALTPPAVFPAVIRTVAAGPIIAIRLVVTILPVVTVAAIATVVLSAPVV